MKLTWRICLAIAVVLCGCESELTKCERLTKELSALKEDAVKQQKILQGLLNEQKNAWNTTAKERFAGLYHFEEDKNISLPYEIEVKGIYLKQKKAKQYSVILSLHKYKVLTPNTFIVYLLNEKGLILGKSEEIKRNKTTELEGVITLYELSLESVAPTFFRIETILPK